MGAVGAGPRVESCLGADRFSQGPHERFGDLFPLPPPDLCGCAGDVRLLRSRRSKQRVGRRRTLADREFGTIWALNTLAGFPDEAGWPRHCLNHAQESANSRVRRAHGQRAPPPDSASPQAALRQLLQKKAGSAYGVDQPGQLATFVRNFPSRGTSLNPWISPPSYPRWRDARFCILRKR